MHYLSTKGLFHKQKVLKEEWAVAVCLSALSPGQFMVFTSVEEPKWILQISLTGDVTSEIAESSGKEAVPLYNFLSILKKFLSAYIIHQ